MSTFTWVPILCYHDLVPRGGLATATPYAVEERRFASQMRLMHALGYRTISVREAARYVRESRTAPRNAFVITFDDGYRSVLTRALPTLRTFSYTATVYLVADLLTDPG